jgi:hypothetical protein
MKLKTKLKKLKLSNELENYVIDYILDDYKTDDEIKCFFSDLLNNGLAFEETARSLSNEIGLTKT